MSGAPTHEDLRAQPKMPRRCRWGFHPWNGWSKKFIVNRSHGAYSEIQQRICPSCGFIEEREI